MPPGVVLMGVSGCGKSAIAKGLADSLGWCFIEGDDLHPSANIEKMASGEPLNDEDRWPFLANVGDAIAKYAVEGVVVSCSALKRKYRDFIRARGGDVLFMLPVTSRETLIARLRVRQGHFMPLDLLESQIGDLEFPDGDEAAVLVDGEAAIPAQITQAKQGLIEYMANLQ